MTGGFISGTDRDEVAEDQAAENTGKEWSDPELIELGNALIRGLPICMN
jgi:hypothetical protein